MKPLLAQAVVAAAAIASLAEAMVSSRNDIQQRPNIIVIQPDDHLFLEEWNPPGHFRMEAGAWTSTFSPSASASTSESPEYISPVPNINRIRNQGLEMTNAYAASTMCGTSRYSTLTGRLPSRSSYGRSMDQSSPLFLRDVIIPKTKLEDVSGVEDSKDCTSNNLAAVLKQNGYSTGVVGKWHLEADSKDANALYNNYGRVQENVRRCGFDFAEAIYRENLGGDKNWNVDGGVVTHNMEHITAEAIRFIQESVNGGQNKKTERDTTGATLNVDTDTDNPFFLYFNPTVPHSSGDVTDALSSGNCRETVQGRLSEDPKVPYGMTASYDSCRQYRRTVLDRAAAAATGSSDESNDQDKWAGAVWVDDAIGSLFETLEALDILSNTLILFQLDHGVDAKGTLFEGGSRIVQFIHYPDQIQVGGSEEATTQQQQQQQGWKFDGLVSTIDVAPTLMDLAGVPVKPPTEDGAENGNQQNNPVKHRYGMDGKSWFSDVIAANTGAIEINSPQQQQQLARQGRIHNNYFDKRCLFLEEGLDRAVRCGCYKYIYISDTFDGRTVDKAEQQGVYLDTHNYYYLCDETTGSYINSPEMSPELWPISSDSAAATRERFTNDLKKQLKKKVTCLMEQTDPSNKFPDYETACDLPLEGDEDESDNVEDDSSSVGTSEITTVDVIDNEPPADDLPTLVDSEPPGADSPTFVESNQTIHPDITDVENLSESGLFGEGDVPFLRSPTSSSTASSLVDTIPNYAIIIVALLLFLAPCFIYWVYREICRRFIVGAKADRYRSKFKQEAPIKDSDTDIGGSITADITEEIEVELLKAAIKTNNNSTADLEVGSAVIHKTGSQIAEEFGSDYNKSYQPMIWRKLADEIKRQSFLRAKWNVYTVSGVVIESSSSTIGTDASTGTSEPAPSTLLGKNLDDSEEMGERDITETREGKSILGGEERTETSKDEEELVRGEVETEENANEGRQEEGNEDTK